MRKLKYIKNYLNFSESLQPSIFRDYMNIWKEYPELKKRYEDIFKKYDGDKNHYRIYIPLLEENVKNKLEIEISKFLDDNGYEVINYINGICKFKSPMVKNTSKIGQILTRLKNDELVKKFIEDPNRKSGSIEDKIVCISRHPYDISGADTDRNWKNCMSISTNKDKEKIKKEKITIKELESNLEEVISSFYNLIDNYNLSYNIEQFILDIIDQINMFKTTVLNEDIDGMYKNLLDENCEKELIDKIIEYLKTYSNLKKDYDYLSTLKRGGVNTHYLINDIYEGSLIAYLIYKSDRNINNPIANLAIKPFINDDDENDILLVSDKKMYGQGSEIFKKTVDNWLKEVNGNKKGNYTISKNIYNDSGIYYLKVDKDGNHII